MQPSLSAQAGRVTGPPITYSPHVYQTIQVLADLSMRMETAAILILRKVLDPDIPAHQVICCPFFVLVAHPICSIFFTGCSLLYRCLGGLNLLDCMKKAKKGQCTVHFHIQ